jgi:hypothetical protein
MTQSQVQLLPTGRQVWYAHIATIENRQLTFRRFSFAMWGPDRNEVKGGEGHDFWLRTRSQKVVATQQVIVFVFFVY